MSLQTIPEEMLYGLLPEGIIDKDARGLLEAVVSGYQDRLEDLRSAVKRYEVFLDPQQTTPEGDSNSLLVSLVGPQGGVISRSVQVDDTTPPADEPEELVTWTATYLEVDEDRIISVGYASDPLRVIDVNLLEYLASTIGAVIYKTDVTASSTDRQRQIVESYFPRLKVKGTAISYDVLGRLLGFDDVQFTPLWGRATPRLPNDPGSPVNSPDFASQPQYHPTPVVTVFYDPNKLDDGPYFQWSSGTLINTPSDPDYFTAVNALNPFIVVKVTGTATVAPEPGQYVLSGGGPHTKAKVVPDGSGLTFEAIAEGASFNGLSVEVTATGSNNASRQLAVTDRLSAIKYRTSYYNLGLYANLDTLSEDAIVNIKKNKDLQNSPVISSAGTVYSEAVSPFFPYSSGTQVGVSTEQLDFDSLSKLGAQAASHFEEVRAATRLPRQFSVGYVSTDQAEYAAFRSRTDLFFTTASGTYSGTAIGFPTAPYDTSVAVQVEQIETASRATLLDAALTATLLQQPDRSSIVLLRGVTVVGADNGQGQIISLDPTVVSGTIDYTTRRLRVLVSTQDLTLTVRYQALVALSAEFDAINSAVVNFSGSGITGFYNSSSGSFNFSEIDAGLPNGQIVAALWSPSSTEVVRSEPSGTLKALGYVDYQARPEDEFDFKVVQSGTGTVHFQLHDEYAWRRPITASGELVDANLYQPPTADLKVREVEDVMVVIDHHGVEKSLIGLDNFGERPVETLDADHDVFDFEQRIIRSGGSLSPRTRAAVTHLVLSLKRADIWPKITDMGLFVGSNLKAALVKLKTAVGQSPTLVNKGLTDSDYSETGFDLSGVKGGAGKYIDTDVPTNISIDPNSAHMAFFTGTPFEINNLTRPMAVSGAANTLGFSKRNTNNFQYRHFGTDVADTASPFGSPTPPTVSNPVLDAGFYLGQFSSGNIELYKDGFLLAQKNHTPLSMETLTVFLLAQNSLGSPIGNTDATQLQLYSIGKTLSSTEVVNLSWIVQRFQDEVGRYLALIDPIRVTFADRESDVTLYQPGNATVASTDAYLVPGTQVLSLPGSLYHVGLVQGVMVADPTSFFHPSHRDGLIAWLPFNEHPDDDIDVADRSATASAQQLTQVQVESRTWDATRGWHLRMRPGMAVRSDVDRNATSQVSLAFRIKPYDVGTRPEDSTFLSYGPISFDLSPRLDTITAYVTNDDGVRVKAAVMRLFPGWTFVTARASGNNFIFRTRQSEPISAQASIVNPSVLTSEVSAPAASYLDFAEATLEVVCVDAHFGIHDLRIWDTLKLPTDLERVCAPPYTPTVVTYPQHHFLTAGLQEQWGLTVLKSGLVVPHPPQPDHHAITQTGSLHHYHAASEQQQQVLRYGDDARYTGDLRFKEVGLGGGQVFPGEWKMGNRVYPVFASGDVVVSTTHTTLPGVNEAWDALFAGTGTLLAGDTIAPGLLTHANPAQERIWVEGSDRRMYEVTVDDDGVRPYLVAEPFFQERDPLEFASTGSLQYMHQPTGAETQVTSNGTVMSVRVHASGTYEVYPGTVVLAHDRPPVYLYNRSQVVVDQAGTANWDNRTDFGLALGVPARDRPGVISFLNSGTLLAGPHRLEVDASVVGNPGIGFPGFDVEVTVGQDTTPLTLLAGATIQEPRSTASVELDITTPLRGLWSVEFNWLNDLDVPAQGLFRDLAIHGYTVRRLSPRLYKVVSNTGSLQSIDVTAVPPAYLNIPPGGFLATLSSTGTIDAWLHESQDASRPEDDSFKSNLPLSELLTASTEAKREDVVLVSYTGTLFSPTPTAPPLPVVSVAQSVASPLTTVWMWAGAVTPSSVNIRARVSASGYVRAVVSTTPNFVTRKYSNTVFVSNDFVSNAAGLLNNIAALTVEGLEPGTTYYYAIGDLAQFDFTKVGTFKTWPKGQASFSFAMSCAAATGSTSEVFHTIRDADPLFFLHMGDMHQQAIASNTGTLFQDAFESTLVSSTQASLYRSAPIVYMWDDVDYGPTQSDSSAIGKQAAQTIFRQYVPSYQLVDSGPIYHAFTVGRVYFIVTDLRSARDPVGNTDTAFKTMMGATQKAWFKRQLLDANGRYPLIVWVSASPWVFDTVTSDDGWCRYTFERAEIANFIRDNGIKGVVIVSGNMHALAADDGSNSDYASGSGGAGVPVLNAGALDATPSTKGGPFSEGSIEGTGQWALVTVTDSGTTFDVNFSGRNAANEEILSFSFSPEDSPN